MPIREFAIVYLGLWFVLGIRNPLLIRKARVWILVGALSLILLLSAVAIYQQYLSWQAGELTRLFLPPYQSWDYFTRYSFIKYLAPYGISFGVGLIFWLAATYFNRKYEERFFYPEEPWLFFSGIFLTGHPGWIIYLGLLPLVGAIVPGFHFWSSQEAQRFSLYYLWFPLAVSAIIISEWLITISWFKVLKL